MFSVYFASDRSSSGKSVITMAFSAMLKETGYSLSVYKTGPDFIDPAVLSEALDSEVCVKNLDPFLIPEKYLPEWFFTKSGIENGKSIKEAEAAADAAADTKSPKIPKRAFVVESAMGLYDGNSFYIPKKFKLPVVLIMDCRRISATMASLIYGLKNYKKGIDVCGVILNNISSQRHYEIISKEIQNNVQGVKIFGYVDRSERIFSIKERHLGLTAFSGASKAGKKKFAETVSKIKEAVFQNIDFDFTVKILEEKSKNFNKLFERNLAAFNKACGRDDALVENDAVETNGTAAAGAVKSATRTAPAKKTKIAVALDKAFFFYYNFNFEILKSFGAEIIFFSPLKDKSLPKETQAVYIGGGYPEIYAAVLAKNLPLRKEIYGFFKNNGIIYAECGGLMYLCKSITHKGRRFDALNILPFGASMDKGALSLGYRTIRLKEKSFLGAAGLTANGHEFHYSKLVNISGPAEADAENSREAEYSNKAAAKTERNGGSKTESKTENGEENKAESGDADYRYNYSYNDNYNKCKTILEYESINSPGIFKPEGYNILNAVGSYIHLSFYSNKLIAENFVKNAKNGYRF